MALVAHALSNDARWLPVVNVRYSTPEGASYQDPLEFAPIGSTIHSLITLCGGLEMGPPPLPKLGPLQPDIVLFVRVPGTGAALDRAFLAQIYSALDAGDSVAVADLSFEENLRRPKSIC